MDSDLKIEVSTYHNHVQFVQLTRWCCWTDEDESIRVDIKEMPALIKKLCEVYNESTTI